MTCSATLAVFHFLAVLWMVGLGLAIVVGQGTRYVHGTNNALQRGIRFLVRSIRIAILRVVRITLIFIWNRLRQW